MSTYVIHKNEVFVIGRIWQPGVGVCSYVYEPTSRDVENMRDENGVITREEVEQWVALNARDFRSVTDFSASLWDGKADQVFAWASEESEMTFADCMGILTKCNGS